MKKILISSLTILLSLMIVISSISVSADWNADEITFQDTVVSMTKGWEAGCSLTVDISKKFCTLTPYETSSHYTQQPTQPVSKDFPEYNSSKSYFRINNMNAYTGKLVEVPVIIGNNPGIFSAKLNIKYDKSVLTFKSIKPGTVFTASEIYYGPTSSDILNIAFESTDLLNNNTKNGVIATLVFEVNTNAKLGSTPISFANYDESDYISCEAEKVPFTFGNGSVNVMAAPKVLAAPSKITVTQVSNKKAVISWNTVSGAKGYEIFRKVNSGKWTSYKTIINAKTKSYVVNSLVGGKTYSYKVRAFSTELVSSFTAAKTIKTYKLSQVKSVKSKVKGKTVTLSWSKTGNAQQYQVYVSTKKSSGYKCIKTVNTNKATINLKAKKNYYIKVRALRKVGTSKQTVYGKYSVVKSIKTK